MFNELAKVKSNKIKIKIKIKLIKKKIKNPCPKPLIFWHPVCFSWALVFSELDFKTANL